MGSTLACMEKLKKIKNNWSEDLKQRGPIGDQGIDGRILRN
jgi:hypothetical protein